jgi:hypothetical protein
VALYQNKVRQAVVALSALQQQMLADLDFGAGGINWWCDQLDTGRRILIGDYLMGLTDSTESNLVEATMHAERARELWYADDFWFRQRLAAARLTGSLDLRRDEHANNRLVEANGQLNGFFRAVGSVLDNTAGLVVGVVGLQRDIVRSDLRDLRLDKSTPAGCLPAGDPGRDVQLAAIDVVRRAVRTGPADWERWVDDMRNTLVHRARRMSLNLPGKSKDQLVRPLPRNPAQTETEAMARSSDLSQDRLREHANATLSGVLAICHDVVAATASHLVQLWARRRAQPDLIPQPAQQWPRLRQGREMTFPGFTTEQIPRLEGSELRVNESHARRFQGARILDGAGDWATWLDEPDLPRP